MFSLENTDNLLLLFIVLWFVSMVFCLQVQRYKFVLKPRFLFYEMESINLGFLSRNSSVKTTTDYYNIVSSENFLYIIYLCLPKLFKIMF